MTGLVKDKLLGCMGQVLQQGVDRIGEFCDRASEGQAAGMYGAGFTVGSLGKNGCHENRKKKWITLTHG